MSDEIQQILNEVQAEQPAPAQQAAPTAQPAQQAAPVEQPQQTKRWGINWNGRDIYTDKFDTFKQWAQQGYDYSQKMEAFNKERTTWEEKVKAAEPWQKYDEYAKANPGWWEHIQQQWEQRDQYAMQGQNPDVQNVVQRLVAEKLAPVENFIKQWDDFQQNERANKADEQLRGEVDHIAKQYPGIPLNTVDASGKTLEMKVLDYASEHGIPSFKAAFFELMHDKVVEMERVKAREEALKSVQQTRKAGIMGESPTPQTAANGAAHNYNRGSSYNDLAKQALQELGIN